MNRKTESMMRPVFSPPNESYIPGMLHKQVGVVEPEDRG